MTQRNKRLLELLVIAVTCSLGCQTPKQDRFEKLSAPEKSKYFSPPPLPPPPPPPPKPMTSLEMKKWNLEQRKTFPLLVDIPSDKFDQLRVSVFEITGMKEHPVNLTNNRYFHGWPFRRKRTVDAKTLAAQSAVTILNDVETYSDSGAACFSPGFGLRFTAGDYQRDVVICLHCQYLHPTKKGEDLIPLSGAGYARLMALYKEFFPDDKKSEMVETVSSEFATSFISGEIASLMPFIPGEGPLIVEYEIVEPVRVPETIRRRLVGRDEQSLQQWLLSLHKNDRKGIARELKLLTNRSCDDFLCEYWYDDKDIKPDTLYIHQIEVKYRKDGNPYLKKITVIEGK